MLGNLARDEVFRNRLLVTALFGICIALCPLQSIEAAESLAIKSGESIELGTLFWVTNCRSILKGSVKAEILEGPSGLSVTVRDQKVVPRSANCAKEVPGGILVLTADKDVKARAQGKLTIRMKYPTLDGERQKSREIDMTVLP